MKQDLHSKLSPNLKRIGRRQRTSWENKMRERYEKREKGRAATKRNRDF